MGSTVLIAAVKYACVLGGSVGGVCVGVGVIAWARKRVCGWYSLNCCCKVCMCVRGVWGECVGVIVWVCGCDCEGEEGSVWVGQP